MAAGIWGTGTGLGDANIAVAARTIQLALNAAIKNRAIMGHPVILDLMMRDQALGQLLGELGVSIGLTDIGTGKMIAVAEATEATPTNFSITNSTTVTPLRRAYARDVTDFGVSVQGALLSGELGPNIIAMLALDAIGCWFNDLIDRIVALFASASNVIGVTGTALSWGAVQDGTISMLDRGNQSIGLGFLSAKAAQDLANDGLSLGGAVGFDPATRQFQANLGKGAYLGTHWGVDFYLNSELDASGGDTYGGILTPGALLMKHQRVPLPSNADQVFATPFLTCEARRPGGGVNRYEYVSHNAVAILENARMSQLLWKTT